MGIDRHASWRLPLVSYIFGPNTKYRRLVLMDDEIVCAGIDLGTSNSALAVLVGGVPEIIPNKEGAFEPDEYFRFREAFHWALAI